MNGQHVRETHKNINIIKYLIKVAAFMATLWTWLQCECYQVIVVSSVKVRLKFEETLFYFALQDGISYG